MVLIEQDVIAPEILPIVEFRSHLRLGTGFADDALQDGILETSLRAALSQVEHLTGKAAFRRGFRLVLTSWQDSCRQVLPRAPLAGVRSMIVEDRGGTRVDVPLERLWIEHDEHRPFLDSRGGVLPGVPLGGKVEIVFDAGYSLDWGGIPRDLAQAVMLLAAANYEDRSGQAFSLPPAVVALLSPYRPLRLSRGMIA